MCRCPRRSIKKKTISNQQLKSYIIWLVHRAYANKIAKPDKTIDFEKLVTELISVIDSTSIETGLWILSNCIDIGTNNAQIIPVVEDFVVRLNLDDLWKESAKSSFLAFTSSVLKRADSYLEVPYATISAKETSFFGIVAETLLKGAFDLEKEKKTVEFDENTLRNRFLAILKARFDGLATSETFRYKGLTDIIVTNPKNHYEEIVIECKIWRGEKYYHKAIDQAVSYLTKSENKVIILSFFKGVRDCWSMPKKIIEAVRSKPRFISLAEGIVSLDAPTFSRFGDHYLFSWQGRENGTKVGIYHIYVALS